MVVEWSNVSPLEPTHGFHVLKQHESDNDGDVSVPANITPAAARFHVWLPDLQLTDGD